MRHRRFEQLLGETELERTCRFIFGVGTLLLVTLSFWLYGARTEALVIGQTTHTARGLVRPILLDLHSRAYLSADVAPLLGHLSDELDRRDDLPRADHRVLLAPGVGGDVAGSALDDFESAALARFLQSAEGEPDARGVTGHRRPYTFADGSPREDWRILSGKKQYRYVQAVLFTPGCLASECHAARPIGPGQLASTRPGDFACAVAVTLPMDQINKDIHKNRAMLITAALVTAILAMFGAFAAIRYVIVRPLGHLGRPDAGGSGGLGAVPAG